MLTRCYSKKYLESYPSYIGTSVCSEWLSAKAFRKWMEQQDWHGKCLDKDIIVPGNKLYSPETCAFVLPATNSFVIACDARRGDYPIGVSLLNVQTNIKPVVETISQESRKTWATSQRRKRRMRLGANANTSWRSL